MPRPDLSSRRTGVSTAKSNNPFANWLANRKERQRQAEDEASRMITNKIAENETIIIDQLNSIDFLHSKLPKSVLEAKSRPEQRYGDLEYAAQGVIHMLMKNPQIIKMDIRKFDQKLLTLVLLFKQTVEQGDVRAAYAAKGAIVRAVSDIRSRIPQNQPELAKQFVEANAQYLDSWITLVTLAQVADRTKQNVDVQRDRHEKALANDKAANENLRQQILDDPDAAEAFKHIMDHDSPADRTLWTESQRKMHLTMVERRMDKVNLDLNALLLQQQEMDLSTKEAQVEVLYSKVAALPIVTDPDLMSKFQENIDQIFQQLAKSDAEIDETLKTMDDIEGRIQQLNSAPGALRAREVATEEAERAVKEISKLQNDQTGKNAARARKIREDLGIYSDEQLAEMKKVVEAEEQRAIEELREMMSQEVDEQEQNVIVN